MMAVTLAPQAAHRPSADLAGFASFAAGLAGLLDAGEPGTWQPDDRIDHRVAWDSLAHVEVAEWLELQGVHLPEGLLEEVLTLGDLHHYATSPATQAATLGRSAARASDLTPVAPVDQAELFRLFTTGEHLTRYRLRGTTPSPEVFHRQLWDRVLVQFAVRAGGQGPVLGLVTAFDPDLRNRHVHVSAVADPSVEGNGRVANATVELIDHLFASFDLRKVYAEALQRNLVQFASGAGRWFEVEGRLRDHEFIDGAYEDLVLVSTTHEAWIRRRPPIARAA